jgi:hypothetical protein
MVFGKKVMSLDMPKRQNTAAVGQTEGAKNDNSIQCSRLYRA